MSSVGDVLSTLLQWPICLLQRSADRQTDILAAVPPRQPLRVSIYPLQSVCRSTVLVRAVQFSRQCRRRMGRIYWPRDTWPQHGRLLLGSGTSRRRRDVFYFLSKILKPPVWSWNASILKGQILPHVATKCSRSMLYSHCTCANIISRSVRPSVCRWTLSNGSTRQTVLAVCGHRLTVNDKTSTFAAHEFFFLVMPLNGIFWRYSDTMEWPGLMHTHLIPSKNRICSQLRNSAGK